MGSDCTPGVGLGTSSPVTPAASLGMYFCLERREGLARLRPLPKVTLLLSGDLRLERSRSWLRVTAVPCGQGGQAPRKLQSWSWRGGLSQGGAECVLPLTLPTEQRRVKA